MNNGHRYLKDERKISGGYKSDPAKAWTFGLPLRLVEEKRNVHGKQM